ncbi:MAG TPA: hypothetical protein ENN81_09045 [Phycisphaerales bacterium]|nr:hypothetical protein [Phycisphaerales bacterium]
MKLHGMLTGQRRLWVVMVLAAVLCGTGGAAVPKTAQLLPSKTVFLVEVENFQTLWDQFKRTSFYGLYMDPAMKPFLDDFHTKRKDKASKADNEIVQMIFGAGTLPSGRVAGAVVLPESGTGEPAFVVLAEWGDKLATAREAIEKMVSQAVDDGARKSRQEYRGVEVTTITTVDAPQVGSGSGAAAGQETDAEASGPESVSYCFVGDCLIAGDQMPVIEFVIAHIQGAGGSTLAQSDDYRSAMKAVGPDHDADLYLNIREMVRMLTAESQGGQAMMIVENLGLDNVVSLAGALGVARQADRTSALRLLLKVDGAKRGICRMLDIKSSPLQVPKFFPADATSVFFLSLDVKQAFDELIATLNRFSPQYAAIAQMPFIPIDPQNGLFGDIKSAIIDNLGTDLAMAGKVSKSGSALDPAATLSEMVVAMTVGNRPMLEKSLSAVHAMMLSKGNPEMRRELLGHTIYRIDLLSLMGGGEMEQTMPMTMGAEPPAPQIPTLAFTITDSHVIVGSEASVERAIRAMAGADAGTLDSAAWYRRARAAIPAMVGLAGLSDAAAAGEHMWQQLREMDALAKGDHSELQLGMSSAGPQILFAGSEGLFDFSLLPEFDKVRKYFGLTAAYGISRQDGFFFEVKVLEPAR